MLQQHTLDKLHTLNLTGMAAAFEQQLAQPAAQELSFEERFALLLDQEILYRHNRRLARLLKAARLRVEACVETGLVLCEVRFCLRISHTYVTHSRDT